MTLTYKLTASRRPIQDGGNTSLALFSGSRLLQSRRARRLSPTSNSTFPETVHGGLGFSIDHPKENSVEGGLVRGAKTFARSLFPPPIATLPESAFRATRTEPIETLKEIALVHAPSSSAIDEVRIELLETSKTSTSLKV
ncbi:hypothetical protein U1Q18_041694 [Sarracenia purpurea var. burkii]